MDEGSMRITVDSGLEPADLIFICVGTPALPDGACDTSQVAAAARGVPSRILAAAQEEVLA